MAGISIEETTRSEGFQFQVEDRPFASFTSNTEVADSLSKWGLPANAVCAKHFRCDTVFRRGMTDSFLTALFNSPAFASAFCITDGAGGTRPYAPHAPVTQVQATPVRATATDLSVFDKLAEGDVVVREATGSIQRCADIYVDGGVTVANFLRAVFMLEEDDLPEPELSDVLTDDDRAEFLVHLMHRVVAGGALCQWDDEIGPYKEACRSLYKDMIVVAKSTDGVEASSELEVQTIVFQIRKVVLADGTDIPLFPRQNRNSDFFYIAIHPQRRTLSIWYHGFYSPF